MGFMNPRAICPNCGGKIHTQPNAWGALFFSGVRPTFAVRTGSTCPFCGVALTGKVTITNQAVLAKAPPKSGPADPWLNKVAGQLAPCGFKELKRNTGSHLEGVPIEGDIGLRGPRKTQLWVNLFAGPQQAEQAAASLSARPDYRQNLDRGVTVVASQGRVLYIAVKPGVGKVDLRLLEHAQKAVPPPPPPTPTPAAFSSTPTRRPQQQPDVLDQLKKLGELHGSGVLSDQEFEDKKTELLKRV
jgi:hypothetical protein